MNKTNKHNLDTNIFLIWTYRIKTWQTIDINAIVTQLSSEPKLCSSF